MVTGQTQTRRCERKGKGSCLSKVRNQSHRSAALAKIYGEESQVRPLLLTIVFYYGFQRAQQGGLRHKNTLVEEKVGYLF